MSKFNLGIAIAISSLLVACAQTTPKYDAKFGDAVRATFQQQVANPKAAENTNAVNGLDGKAANNVMLNYHKSFTAPEENTNVFNIGVGGGSGSSNN